MVDCDAKGAPVCGQRPTATFMSGSWRSRSRSIASLCPQAIADAGAITIAGAITRSEVTIVHRPSLWS
jgi:hypothetical protein